MEEDSSCRGVWSTAKTALGQISTPAPTSLLSQGEVVDSPFMMSETMADHFSNKVDQLRARRTLNPRVDPAQRLRAALDKRLPDRDTLSKMELKPVTPAQLKTIIKRLKGGRALGGDSISGCLLKSASKVLLPALTHLVNL